MSQRDWKRVAQVVMTTHNLRGGSCVTLEGVDAVPLMQASDLRLVPHVGCSALEVQGKDLTRKQISTFLWHLRNHRATKRNDTVVWTVYDKEAGVSTVGVGVMVAPHVAERYLNTMEVRYATQEPPADHDEGAVRADLPAGRVGGGPDLLHL